MRNQIAFRRVNFISIACLFSCGAASAAVINVPADQPTIQAGINAASNGDTVLVAPGTYNQAINFLGKAITVVSANGPDVTVINGTGQNTSVVKFITAEGPTSVLDGFTVTKGIGTQDPTTGYRYGGGIYAVGVEFRTV